MNQFQSIGVRPFAGGGGQTTDGGPDGLPMSQFEQARAMMKAKYGTPTPQAEPVQPLNTAPPTSN